MIRYVLSLAAVLFFYFTAMAGQYDGIPLDQIISLEQQWNMGITKLSPTEKEKLRIFIIDTYLQGFESGKKEASKRSPAVSPMPDLIESQIAGDFEGWEGETIVKLLNGQIWQQSEYYYYYYYGFMQKVLIFKSGGGYRMKVDGIDKAVGVIRLR